MSSLQNPSKLYWTLLAHSLCLTPLTKLIWDSALHRLGPHPVHTLTHQTGFWSLTFLLLSLAVSPVRSLTGFNWVFVWRRSFGLYAFLYATLHLAVFLIFESGPGLFQELFGRRYTLAGTASFLLLLPLAVTSTKEWKRKLKKRWGLLHKLVFPATALAILHFVWLVKWDIQEPLKFAVIFAALLVFRSPWGRQAIKRLRPRAPKTAKRDG